ncbi:MAG: hypothetical protein EAZ36_02135 [Verrucomicrobia bacterium]|nr:MAG: hypothetical protein EAZ36_02135 [Verrucomicrobiota bacterium]
MSGALGIAGAALYIPIDQVWMDMRAHDAQRGERSGARYAITLDGAPHTLELSWAGEGQFAPILVPAPAVGTRLWLKSRFGAETLEWSNKISAFGPTTGGGANPFAHHKLSLRLERGNQVLWKDTLWAYGIHDSHAH